MDLPALIQALQCTEAERRLAAARTLAQMETDAQPAAVALVEACGVDDSETREWIVAALEGLGPPAASDVSKLAALAAHPALDVAYWAATLLGRLKDGATPAVSALAGALAQHAEIAVRQRAAWALGQIGPAARAARPALAAAASSADRRLASLAKAALENIDR